jgi:hypothetical protein
VVVRMLPQLHDDRHLLCLAEIVRRAHFTGQETAQVREKRR